MEREEQRVQFVATGRGSLPVVAALHGRMLSLVGGSSGWVEEGPMHERVEQAIERVEKENKQAETTRTTLRAPGMHG
jgi:hypothetical protein